MASSSSPPFLLKLCYLPHMKLFRPPHPFTFSHLLSLATQTFPDSAPHSIAPHFTYRDCDGYDIIIHDDDSLHLAIDALAGNDSAQLKVVITQAKRPQHSSAGSSSPMASRSSSSREMGIHVDSDAGRMDRDVLQQQQPPSACCNGVSSGSSSSAKSWKAGKGNLPGAAAEASSSSPSGKSESSSTIGIGASSNNSSAESSRKSRKGKQHAAATPASPITPSQSNPQDPRRATKFCPHFRSGNCRYGTNCKFSHHIAATITDDLQTGRRREASPPPRMTRSAPDVRPGAGAPLSQEDVDRWLTAMAQASELDNVTFLSSSQGFDSLLQVIHLKPLPDKLIGQLVNLLTRQNFRNNLLHDETDKIYRALLGSELLRSLHAHVRCSVRATPASVKPYVLLCEELMKRCSDGWKEAPLDELRGLVEDMENEDQLRRVVERLLQQRSKEKKMKGRDAAAAAGGAEGSTSADFEFRSVPLIPAMDQLLQSPDHRKLPVNRVGSRYTNLSSYLETHFKLMQEDCLSSLRDGITQLRDGSVDGVDLLVYKDVKLADVCCGRASIVYRIGFHTKAKIEKSTKRLMNGSLLCFSRDGFHTFLWGVVAERKDKLLSQGMIDVQLLEKVNGEGRVLEAAKTYVMAESRAAYFKAYSHVLLNLQRPEMDELPFHEHLLSLEPQVKEPAYIQSRDQMNQNDVYDFGDAFPDMRLELTTTRFHILQNWPSWSTSLDASQMAALRHGLTKRLALIQGPPGTGKTFVGLMIVRILLHNLKLPPSRQNRENAIAGPILVICYTNHALDQFMKGIYAVEENIVRVGGRSKCPELEVCNLHTLRDAKRPASSLLREIRRSVYAELNDLRNQITECTKQLQAHRVSLDSLQGIASDDQIESLFFGGSDYKKIVNVWLTASDLKPAKRRRRRRKSGGGINANRYQLLDGTSGDLAEAANVAVDDVETSEPENADVTADMEMGRTTAAHDQIPNEPGSHAINGSGLTNGDVEEESATAVNVLEECRDVWSLDASARRALHEHWIRTLKQKADERLKELAEQYGAACRKLRNIESEEELALLRKAKLVGMTTSKAASYHDVLESLQAEVIVVEESAEVLESHVLACLNRSTKHLILIGDHVQLRPSVATYELAVKHHLDVSLFERLVRGGVEYVSLNVQRRMRPSISRLISSLYPQLQDHPSTSQLDHVKGVKSDVFFLHHDSPEGQLPGTYAATAAEEEESSKRNIEEAKLVVGLCAYLLKQGYSESEITILSMYNGQTKEISQRLHQKLRGSSTAVDGESSQMPRISSVDDYQGEECKIIILSLVRSNALPTRGSPGKIGFLAIANRVCVALSRAKNGLYIFGNGELLSEKNELWRNVIQELRRSDSYGDALLSPAKTIREQ